MGRRQDADRHRRRRRLAELYRRIGPRCGGALSVMDENRSPAEHAWVHHDLTALPHAAADAGGPA